MWPFSGGPGSGLQSLWLALYVLTWALHAVFVSYVAVGAGYAVMRRATPLAAQVRDRLPFMLGCGITAGVAPLLFIQLLYQRRFYTGNLLLGPRLVAIVPALVVGFYALYIAKSSEKWRKRALIAGLGAFTFVAWSWTELHQVMMADAAWKDLYAAGTRVYLDTAIPVRMGVWLGGAIALFATVASWSVPAADRSRLALLALVGLAIAGASGAVLGARATHDIAAHGWLYVLVASALVAGAGWLWTWRVPGGSGLALATSGTTAALLSGAVVREAPRLTLLEGVRDTSTSGLVLFFVTFTFGVAAIVWVVRTVRTVREAESTSAEK